MISQRMKKLVLTTTTAFMLVVQCVASASAVCTCGVDTEIVEAGQAEAKTSGCCHDKDSSKSSKANTCCDSGECACGSKCGSGDTVCGCGCTDSGDESVPAPSPEERSQTQVKTLAAGAAALDVASQTAGNEWTRRITARRSQSSSTPAQILLCTWRT